MKTKYYILGILGLLLFVILMLCIQFGIIHIEGFFDKKRQNIETKVFRETQGHIMGKQQQLAKYYIEYTKTKDADSKRAIQNVIQSQFADFDPQCINNAALRQFLTGVRGY